MPLAGQTIRAADFDGYGYVANATDETAFTSTSFTLGGSTTGVAFTAPTSGAVKVTLSARFALGSATNLTQISVEVRTGTTVGSGTVVSAAATNVALEQGQADTQRLQASRVRVVTGLTAGSSYNASAWHVTSAADNATIYDREILVEPLFI